MLSRKLLILFLIILFTVLQCTVLNYIQIFETKPDILLILIIFFSLTFGQIYGLIVGALCGLFSEVTSGVPLGILVSIYSLGGLILGYIARWIYNQTLRGKLCITFVFSFVVYLFLFFIFQIYNINLSFFNSLTSIILPASFYTACVSPFLFRFLRFLTNL